MDALCFIRRPTFNDVEPVEISPVEFDRIAEARDKLVRVSMIEEKFIMVLENFIEFEKQLHGLTLQQAVYLRVDWSEFQDAIYIVNRRLMNLLASCRLYLDQVSHDVSRLFGRHSVVLQTFKIARSHEFDNTLGFMMMEALRNHLQHHSIAVQELSFPGKRHEQDGEVTFHHGIQPHLRVTELRENDRLTQKVRERLASLDDRVCITPWVKEYVEGLSRVHEALHTAMIEHVDQWDAELSSMLERGSKAFGESSLGYVAVRIGEGGREVQVFPEFIKRRRMQRHRTRLAGRMTKTVITNAAEV
jgi:hypothetical protein